MLWDWRLSNAQAARHVVEALDRRIARLARRNGSGSTIRAERFAELRQARSVRDLVPVQAHLHHVVAFPHELTSSWIKIRLDRFRLCHHSIVATPML
jgi:plasmid stabilization system protein ParE